MKLIQKDQNYQQHFDNESRLEDQEQKKSNSGLVMKSCNSSVSHSPPSPPLHIPFRVSASTSTAQLAIKMDYFQSQKRHSSGRSCQIISRHRPATGRCEIAERRQRRHRTHSTRCCSFRSRKQSRSQVGHLIIKYY